MSLVDWIFPKECLKCGTLGEYLCFECKKTLIPHPELCPSCHRNSAGFALCSACRAEEKMALEGIIVGFSYEKWLKKLILKLKFYHKRSVGDFLAQRAELMILTHEKLSLALESGDLVLSWVPSHRWRHYIEKGYNQSEVLAKAIAQRIGSRCLLLAKKSKSTVSQLKLKRAERIDNLKGAFEPIDLEQVKK